MANETMDPNHSMTAFPASSYGPVVESNAAIYQSPQLEPFNTGKLPSIVPSYPCNDTDIIVAVCSYKALYDKSSIYYTDSETRLRIWEAISKELNVDVSYLKKRWKSLRDMYIKSLKKGYSGGESGSGYSREWRYTKHMSFLAPHIETARPYTTTAQELIVADGVELSVDGGDGQQPISEVSAPTDSIKDGPAATDAGETPGNTPQRPVMYLNSKPSQLQLLLDARKREASQPLQKLEPKAKLVRPTTLEAHSSVDHFVRSLIPTMERLTNQQRALAKLQIQDVLYKVEFGIE